jgi:Na+/H+-translocating membrane pyrophosphatase
MLVVSLKWLLKTKELEKLLMTLMLLVTLLLLLVKDSPLDQPVLSHSLFGDFITRMTVVNILEPIQISCLIVGAMMPYAFSALTMKSVGNAADEMVILF